ncbi:MAG TPA: hypothetical protein VGL31_09135 [Xanthobacteraceae bacterium]|jgi:hypothetical protein
MHTRLTATMILAALTGLAVIAAVPVISRAQQDAQQEEPNRADLPPQPFSPQMSALMNMLIQPRHAKLGLAGKAENWILAGYEFNELKAGFLVIGKEVPRYKGLPVADLFDAAMKQIFPVMDFAIKAGDARQFNESYAKITAGCNACHTTADHNYIVIKAPETSSFPNQEFQPK